MNRNRATRIAAWLGALLCAAAALAGPGRLFLKNGTILRGDITESPTLVTLRNAAGEKQFPLAEVERIEFDEPPAEPPAAPPSSEPATTSAPRGPRKVEGPQPPPELSERDILRLKLSEYPLDGPPQDISVEFPRKKGEPTLEQVVARTLRNAADVDPGWERILDKGKPPEKLQLILKHTGLRHLERIRVRGDTETFNRFRRRVLPIVMRGCAKSGCHGGNATHAFRFPFGVPSSDDFAYTSFVVLDSIRTPHGPLIDRELPEQSVLLHYMLPATKAPSHRPLRGQPIPPTLRGTDDPEFKQIAEWIATLRVPHADYQLDFVPPDWLEALSNVSREAPSSQP
jgi:hypothetical protein